MYFLVNLIWSLFFIIQVHGKFNIEDNYWIPRLTNKDLEGYSLVSRIPLTRLFKFHFYRDVSILFYPIPPDVEKVQFTFKAHEEKMNYIGGKCIPQDIDIHLKVGGFPVVNPSNASFPEDFLDNNLRNHIYTVNIKSDDSNNSLIINNPVAGDWFGIAFVKWTDPQADKIEQQGITAVCDTVLYTDMRIIKVNVSNISCDKKSVIKLQSTALSTREVYKCFIDYETSNMLLNLSVIPCDSCRWAVIRLLGQSLPDAENNLVQCAVKFNDLLNQNISLLFSNDPKAWHYIEVLYGNDSLPESYSNITSCNVNGSDESKESMLARTNNVINLVRDTKSEYFTFEYNLPPDVTEDAPTLLNLTSGKVSAMKFNIFPVQDIGGTLSLGATLKKDMKYYMGYKRKKTNQSEYIFSDDDEFYKVVVCTSIGKPLVPNVNESCGANGKWQSATIVINSTDSDSVSNIIHIPYPEIGYWYLTMAIFCDKESVCPCKTLVENNVTKYLVKTEKTVYEGESLRIGSNKCNASVVFSISSASCLSGKCGINGMCNFYMSGGFIYSSCRCKGGYAGWDCSDTKNIIPGKIVLTSVLFLTLSNLLFVLSVVYAIRRKYYTEALVYFFTMFFSTFYHACDVVDANYGFCIVRLGVLQYCDFFCGLLSFWVTLVAMAALDYKIVSLLHMFGSVMIAFGTEMDKQALLVFLIPVVVGVCIVVFAWTFRCRKTRKIFPAKAYLIIYLPAGLILASIGLICYAFLQTNANYHIVHSIWHMIIALSVLCLLPNRSYFIPKS